ATRRGPSRGPPPRSVRLRQDVGVPAGAVQTGEDLWRDVHMRARDYIVTLDHPEPGVVEHPGLTVRLHGTPGQMRRTAGRLGEATDAVFGGVLGLSQDEIAQLVKAGVIA